MSQPQSSGLAILVDIAIRVLTDYRATIAQPEGSDTASSPRSSRFKAPPDGRPSPRNRSKNSALRARDIAPLLGVAENTVFNMARAGKIPTGFKIGKSRRWNRLEFIEFCKANGIAVDATRV